MVCVLHSWFVLFLLCHVIYAGTEENFHREVPLPRIPVNEQLRSVICQFDNPNDLCQYFYNDVNLEDNESQDRFEHCLTMANAVMSVEDCDKDFSDEGVEITLARKFTRNQWSYNMIDAINGYGCWCYLNGDIKQARGKPVEDNWVDYYCKILIHGYKCMALDAHIEEDFDCDPTNACFVSATGFAFKEFETFSKEAAIWEACKSVREAIIMLLEAFGFNF